MQGFSFATVPRLYKVSCRKLLWEPALLDILKTFRSHLVWNKAWNRFFFYIGVLVSSFSVKSIFDLERQLFTGLHLSSDIEWRHLLSFPKGIWSLSTALGASMMSLTLVMNLNAWNSMSFSLCFLRSMNNACKIHSFAFQNYLGKSFSKARNAPKNEIQISDLRDKMTFLEVFFCS